MAVLQPGSPGDAQVCRLRRSASSNGAQASSPIGKGKSKKARLVQELLAINGIKAVIDGDIGPATQAALAEFSGRAGLPKASNIDQLLLDALAQPLLRTIRPVAHKATLGETNVAVAEQHLSEHPTGVGGSNREPWVRLYMDGNEGQPWAWCAGFVTYVLSAAAKARGSRPPLERTYSCDVLGMEAKKEGSFRKKMLAGDAPVGSIFLVPRKGAPNDWEHTGLITGGEGAVFRTIEGNTNDEGSREGFEVCARIRACSKVNVIVVAG